MANILREHRELQVVSRSVLQKGFDALRYAAEQVGESARRRLARGRRGHVARSTLEEPAQRLRRAEAPIEQRGDPPPPPTFAHLPPDPPHPPLLPPTPAP